MVGFGCVWFVLGEIFSSFFSLFFLSFFIDCLVKKIYTHACAMIPLARSVVKILYESAKVCGAPCMPQ